MNPQSPNPLAEVPEPSGAVRVDVWINPDHPEVAYRSFLGDSWSIPCDDDQEHDVTVTVFGLQHGDGSIDRWIGVQHGQDENIVTLSQSLGLARALIAAADEIHTMAEHDKVTN